MTRPHIFQKTISLILPPHLAPKIAKGAPSAGLMLFTGLLSLPPLTFAQTNEQASDSIIAPAAVRQAIDTHPAVQTRQAKVCQALYNLGLRRAEQRPRITGEINGAGHLTSNFNRKKRDRDFSSARGFRMGDDRVLI